MAPRGIRQRHSAMGGGLQAMTIQMKVCNSIRSYQHATIFRSVKSAIDEARKLMNDQNNSVHYVVLEYSKDGLRHYDKVSNP